MNFTITINGERAELASTLKALSESLGVSVSDVAPTAKVDSPVKEEKKAQTKTADKPKPETKQEADQEFTAEDVRAAANELVQKGMRPKLVEILGGLGAKKISELDASSYAAFIEAVKEAQAGDDELA